MSVADIITCPPCTREVFRHLFTRTKLEKSAELECNYRDIMQALKWYENRKEKAYTYNEIRGAFNRLKKYEVLTVTTPDRNRNTGNINVTMSVRAKTKGKKKQPERNPNATGARPDSPRQVHEYMVTREFMDPAEGQLFWDHHKAKGWLIGNSKTPMKDWQAAVRTWLKDKQPSSSKPTRYA